MPHSGKNTLLLDHKLRWIVLGGFIIQLLTCLTATGFYHPDQHFSIVEFATWHLGEKSGASSVWEAHHFVRASIQVYLFSAYHILFHFVSTNPYTELTVLRIFFGLLLLLTFDIITIYYLRSTTRSMLYWALIILNFSWLFPYVRTLFCSEVMSSVFFFGTLCLYDSRKNSQPRTPFLLLVGFLFALSFYFRFQMGFAIAGFGAWLLFVEKKYGHILPLVAGFGIGLALNVYLDYRFYGEWVLTPLNYFYANIVEGRAKSFGTDSVLKYAGLLVAVITAPPFSLVLLLCSFSALARKFTHPIFITTALFVLAHCLVGHKEERFLFPIFNVLPIIVAWGLPLLNSFYGRSGKLSKILLGALISITVIINSFLLFAFILIPYSQTVHFGQQLTRRFSEHPATIYCLDRTPFETESKVPLVFYERGANHINLQRIMANDSIRLLKGQSILVATTFNRARNDQQLIDSLGYKPVLYSSRLLWKVNEYLFSMRKPTINDIWVLYQK